MVKYLFFANDPGGANAISPLINPLKSKINEVFIYGKGSALSKIPDAIELKEPDIPALLKKIKPDCIITGTSANDFTEKFLWEAAGKLNIKTVAILDYWSNYGIRFSSYGTKDIEKYNKDKNFKYLPDYIIVMDEFAKSEMIKEGIDEKLIYPLGNPHFSTIKKQSKNAQIEQIRQKFTKNGEDFIITFASQPYTEDYGKGDELQVLRDLQDIVGKIKKNISIVVKMHPKENISKYSEFENVYIDNLTNPIEIIMASDLVISITSMFLIEAIVMGKNVLSYQPNENDKNKFVLTQNGTLDFINTKEKFEIKVNEQIANAPNLCKNLNINDNAIEDVMKFLENKICQN